MTAAVPDAWDECGGCGHDRDDHTGGTGVCQQYTRHDGWTDICPCTGFQEPAA